MTDLTLANKSLPVIAGVEINTDTEGRFNLNSLHKASGKGEDKSPSQWMRRATTKALVNELSVNSHLGYEVIKSVKGGIAPGTFAHELLAVEYAGWISPSYRLKVNQTFLDYKTGKLKPAFDPMAALNDPEFLRGTLLTYSEKVIALEHKVEEMTPDVEALERIAKSDGTMCITNAAKHLQVQPKFLFKMMSENHWIYRRTGGRTWLAYQERIQQGVLEHKVTTVSRGDGSEKVVEQALVTAKGLTKLSKMLGINGVAA
ncbi:phage antirepressor KilAC domain-containing protein [Yersinia mollaretii]|uniref:DNA-binding protein (Roi) n=1 Tax=Yersinia mollaretii TaxID=33060 RepID=A0AA36PP42_YERMO|nr:phage antirepressor KilAC domain-containing protein [Yersinia mollaretii]CNI32403.1 putative DNA-binding protein (Roi) [Yersinia mollaretii]HEN3638611.1 phage antirepressor KilAC domain-containing protein [Yersinia enterocolitica]